MTPWEEMMLKKQKEDEAWEFIKKDDPWKARLVKGLIIILALIGFSYVIHGGHIPPSDPNCPSGYEWAC